MRNGMAISDSNSRLKRPVQSQTAGWIKKIRMQNFMCHANVEVEFIDKVNFITGQNGSGKSAILTALCVAFGSKAKATQRADTLKKLIRTGCSIAFISVEINNSGDDAFKHNIYGDTIILERSLRESGANLFTLKNHKGKKISGRKDDVDELAKHFNIDVDNPCVIMTQDKSREFLHSGSSKDKFKFFIKASLLENLSIFLNQAEQNLNEIQSSLQLLKEKSKPINQKIDGIIKKIKELEDLASLDESIMTLKKQLIWNAVYDIQKRVDDVRKEMEYHNQRCIKSKQKHDDAVIGEEKVEEDCSKMKEEMMIIESNNQILIKNRQKTLDDFKNITRICSEADTKLGLKLSEIKREEKQIQFLKQKMEIDKKKKEENTKAEATQKETELNQKNDELNVLTNELKNFHDEEKKIVLNLESEKQNISSLMKEKEELDSRLSSNRGLLNRLKNQSRNKVTAFGGDKVVRLLEEININKNKFIKMPIGPIGNHVSLVKESQYSLALEIVIGRLFDQFIVCNYEDKNTLSSISKRINFSIPIIIFDFNVNRIIPSKQELPDDKLTKIMDIIKIDNHVVHNVLIELGFIEKTILVKDYNNGKEVAFSNKYINIKECITENGLRMFKKENQEVNLSKPYNIRSARIMQNLDEEVKKITKEIDYMMKEMNMLIEKQRTSEGKYSEEENKLNKIKRLIWELEKKIRMKKNEIKDITIVEEEKEEEENSEQLKNEQIEEINSLEKTIEENSNEFEQIQKSLSKSREEEKKFKFEFEKANDEFKAGIELSKEKEKEFVSLLERKENYTRAVNHFKQVMENEQTQTQTLNLKLNDMENEENLAREKASSYCVEEENFKTCTMSSQRIKEKILSLQSRLESERNRNEGLNLEEMMLIKERLARKCEKYRVMINIFDYRIKILSKLLNVRKKSLQSNALTLKRDLSLNFNRCLSRKGFGGKVDVDYKNETLTMEVFSTSDEKRGVTKDTRALSGGERSFSTLCFALSLHLITESSFRAMDEFDIFMDSITRKICLNEVVKFALEDKSQWIFITPQDISSVKAGPNIHIQEMLPPRP